MKSVRGNEMGLGIPLLSKREVLSVIDNIVAGQTALDFSRILNNEHIINFFDLGSPRGGKIVLERNNFNGFNIFLEAKGGNKREKLVTVIVHDEGEVRVIIDICNKTFICMKQFSARVREADKDRPRVILRVIEELEKARLAPARPTSNYPNMNRKIRVQGSIGFTGW